MPFIIGLKIPLNLSGLTLFDVAIIGGGPAGLAAGIALARAGFKTALFEKKKFPVDKACGEGVMPPGVELLSKLGVLESIINAGAQYFDGISYAGFLSANFAEGPGLAIKRSVLSKALFDVATHTSGLTVYENTEVSPADINANLIVGADGIRSPTRAWMGLDSRVSHLRRYGVNQHYLVKPWSPKVEIYVRDGFEAYVTPCGENEIGLAFLWDIDKYEPAFAGKEIVTAFLSEFPSLKSRLLSAEKTGKTQAMGHFYRPVPWPVSSRGVLIGDAAGYVDPMTGEGISLALSSAKLLVQCLTQKRPLSWYGAELRKQRRAHLMTTHVMLFLAQHPNLRDMSMRCLAKYPRLFQRLLSLNMGH